MPNHPIEGGSARRLGHCPGSDGAAADVDAGSVPQAVGEAWRGVLVVHVQMRAVIERAAGDAGVLPVAWFDLLVTLDGTPGGRVRLGDLAEVVLLTRAGLSRLVDRVEAAGLLRREACPSDKRGAFAALTPAGAAAVRRAWPVYRRAIMDHFGRHLPDPAAIAAGLTAVMVANGWASGQRPVQLTVPTAADGIDDDRGGRPGPRSPTAAL